MNPGKPEEENDLSWSSLLLAVVFILVCSAALLTMVWHTLMPADWRWLDGSTQMRLRDMIAGMAFGVWLTMAVHSLLIRR